MTRLKHILLLAAAGLACWLPQAGSAASARPNILLLVADDLGYGDVSAYGNREFATPHLDALAGSGMRFTAGYATTPLCGPSRAGLLTGRHPCRFLPYEGNPPPGSPLGMPTEEKTIADRLKAAGYRTAALGKWHLGEQEPFHPLSRGFDEFYGFLSGMHSYTKTDDPKWGPILRGRQREELKQYLTFALADEACAFIGRQGEQPYFLYLAFNAPHTPMEAPEEYLAKTKHLADPLRRINAAMILALDDAVGRVLDALRKGGQEERTLIVLVSDNGAPLLKGAAINGGSNAPLRGGKTQLWEGGIRVPFAISWKGKIAAGGVSAEPVSALDILPTALAAAGVAAEAAWKLEGLNLLPWLQGAAASAPKRESPLFWRFGARGSQFAVREGDLKRVKVAKDEGLYEVSRDLGETADLLRKQPGDAARLEQQWRQWDAGNVAVRLVGEKAVGHAP